MIGAASGDEPFREIRWEVTWDVVFVPAGCSADCADGHRVAGPAFITGPASSRVLAAMSAPPPRAGDPDEADLLAAHDPCPMGCGRTTEDPYGGPCEACWEAT